MINNNANLISIIGIFVGAVMLLFQSYLQHRSNVKLQREVIKDDLKRKFHDEIEKKLTSASNDASRLSSLLRNIYWIECSSIRLCLQEKLETNGFKTTVDDFMKLYNNTTESAIKLIFVIEKYEIISPEIKIFQTAINVALYDMNEYHMKILREIMRFLPSNFVDNNGNKKIISKPFPSDEQMKDYIKTYENFETGLLNLENWLYDFRVEIQNILLGSLFKNKIAPRKPIDKKWIVITSDKKSLKKLSSYFENETIFGKNKKKVENRVGYGKEKN